MARIARVEVFAPDEIAIVHVLNRTVRRFFLMGNDPVSGKNFDHRKAWMETELQSLAKSMGIDLLFHAILSNHFHLVLRSRPDVVALWDDSQVALRWLMLCPKRRDANWHPEEPNEFELNSIRNDPARLKEIRSRLSDVSWWMRLLSQKIAQRANLDDNKVGKFWQARYRAVRLLDETAILACAAYVDLNPIRAAMAETIETSDYTSAQQRALELRELLQKGMTDNNAASPSPRVDSRLWPVVRHGSGQAEGDRIDTQSQPSPAVQDSEPCSRVAHGIDVDVASSLIALSRIEETVPGYRSTHCTHCAALSWRRDANFSVFLDGADHNGSKPASPPIPFSVDLHLVNDGFACVPIVAIVGPSTTYRLRPWWLVADRRSTEGMELRTHSLVPGVTT